MHGKHQKIRVWVTKILSVLGQKTKDVCSRLVTVAMHMFSGSFGYWLSIIGEKNRVHSILFGSWQVLS